MTGTSRAFSTIYFVYFVYESTVRRIASGARHGAWGEDYPIKKGPRFDVDAANIARLRPWSGGHWIHGRKIRAR